MSIYGKLAKLREAANIKKNGRNKYGKFNYYQIEDIYTFLKPKLKELGLFSTVEFVMVDTIRANKELGDRIVENDKPVIKCSLIIHDAEESNFVEFSNISALSDMKGMSDPQSAGANITYMIKYSWAAALMLDDGLADPDRPNNNNVPM